MKKFFCQGDGAQWNVPVEVVYSFAELHVVKAFMSTDMCGYVGSDGFIYALVPDCDLFDTEQP